MAVRSISAGGALEGLRPRRGRYAGHDKAGPASYFVLVSVALLSLFPLYWMFVVASNGNEVLSRIPPAVIPGGKFAENTQNVIDTIPFVASLLNSLMVSSAITISVVFFSTLAGFAFAKLRFRGRGALFIVIITTMMVPVQLGIIPQYMLIARLGWIDQLQAVIVPGMVTAFGVFWMRQYISSAVPDELLDAGRVDGCSVFRLYRHVVIPAIRPAALVLALLTFMHSWNEFFWPLVVLRDPAKRTVQVALQGLNSAYFQDYGMIMAGTALAVLPVIAVFLLLGRHIIGGLMEGAIKG